MRHWCSPPGEQGLVKGPGILHHSVPLLKIKPGERGRVQQKVSGCNRGIWKERLQSWIHSISKKEYEKWELSTSSYVCFVYGELTIYPYPWVLLHILDLAELWNSRWSSNLCGWSHAKKYYIYSSWFAISISHQAPENPCISHGFTFSTKSFK